MIKTLLICTFCVLTLNGIAGDQYAYAWMDGKKEVGEIIITVDIDKDGTTYTWSSSLDVNVGIDMKVEETCKARYDEAHLLDHFTFNSKVNGIKRASINESNSGDGVVRLVNGREKVIQRPDIPYGYILLFVKAPKGLSEVYSELYGTNFTVSDNGKNSYTVTDSRSREHTFTYDDEGNLVNATVEMTAGKFTLVPR